MRSGLKPILRSPVFRAQTINQANNDLTFVERITPMAQTNPEVGMALNVIGGLKAIAGRMDISPEMFVTDEEFEQRKAQAVQAQQQQQQADTMRTVAQAYQAASRGASTLQDSGQPGFLSGLVERGIG